MKKEFFNLENLFLGSLLLILLIYCGVMTSCIPFQRSGSLSSLDNTTDNDDDDGDREVRYCYDRDSCQDSCDYMFKSSSSRSKCYDFRISDVNDLEEVFDELAGNSVDPNDLEDIDSDDLETFLELDVEAWTDIITGARESGRDSVRSAYSDAEAQNVLKWIAEDIDVAEVILDFDDDNDILYNLFARLSFNNSNSSKLTDNFYEFDLYPLYTLKWHQNKILQFGVSTIYDVSLTGTNDVLEFIMGFIGRSDTSSKLYFEGDSFIVYADYQDNDDAVELAHNSLKRFCEAATDENDGETKQCMQAAYCSIASIDHYSNDNLFNDILDDIGRIGRQDCEWEKIRDEDTFDNRF